MIQKIILVLPSIKRIKRISKTDAIERYSFNTKKIKHGATVVTLDRPNEVNHWLLSEPFFLNVLNYRNLTQSIPNGFSMDELKSMMDKAPHDTETCDCCSETSNESKIVDIAIDILQEALERADGDIMVHKMLVLMISRRFENWHETIAEHLMEDGMNEHAVSWLKDAGHCQLINRTMLSISCGPDDFTINDNE